MITGGGSRTGGQEDMAAWCGLDDDDDDDDDYDDDDNDDDNENDDDNDNVSENDDNDDDNNDDDDKDDILSGSSCAKSWARAPTARCSWGSTRRLDSG